jgi:hypothetical protein
VRKVRVNGRGTIFAGFVEFWRRDHHDEPSRDGAVFDGDPKLLYDIILDPNAEQFIRAGMCEALAMVTVPLRPFRRRHRRVIRVVLFH